MSSTGGVFPQRLCSTRYPTKVQAFHVSIGRRMDQSGWHIRCICLADRVPLLTSHTSLPYFPFSPCRSRQRVTPTFVKGHVRNTLGEEEKKRHAPIVWSGNATDAANDIQAIKKEEKGFKNFKSAPRAQRRWNAQAGWKHCFSV